MHGSNESWYEEDEHDNENFGNHEDENHYQYSNEEYYDDDFDSWKSRVDDEVIYRYTWS